MKEAVLMSSRAALARISALIKAKRRETGLGLRAAATASGVSASTLSRLERGAATSLPDADTLTKLAGWLDVPVGSLLSEDGEAEDGGPELSTPEIVEVHLRSDKELNPKTAKSLALMFRMLYEQLVEAQGGVKKKKS
jgi:transcriptional regulator with XRE-family HTH domain